MSALDVFRYGDMSVRTVLVDGEPWFVAADVTAVLGFANGRMAIARLDEDGVSQADITDSLGRAQRATVLNEPGIYELIMRSDKPEAKAFRRWVTHEVLPSIRRTGQFGSQVPTSLAEALELAAAEARRVEALEAKAIEDAPKVAAYDALMDADGFYTMEVVAKLGGIGRTTLFNRLRDAGVIQSGSRLPYQRYLHWFKITTSTWTDSDGVAHPSNTARVRPESLARVLEKAGVSMQKADV
ncbi:MAG: phage antirepressor [Microbacteriaceae bacterium]